MINFFWNKTWLTNQFSRSKSRLYKIWTTIEDSLPVCHDSFIWPKNNLKRQSLAKFPYTKAEYIVPTKTLVERGRPVGFQTLAKLTPPWQLHIGYWKNRCIFSMSCLWPKKKLLQSLWHDSHKALKAWFQKWKTIIPIYLSKMLDKFPGCTPWKFNPSPSKKPTSQKERIFFQSKHFKGELLNSQDVTHKKGHHITNPNNALSSGEFPQNYHIFASSLIPPKWAVWTQLKNSSQIGSSPQLGWK